MRITRNIRLLGMCISLQVRETVNLPSAYAASIFPGVLYGLFATYRASFGSSLTPTSLVIGATLTTFWAGTIWGSAAVIRRERFGGTLARVISSVANPSLVLFGRGLGASLFTTVVSSVSVLSTVCTVGDCQLVAGLGLQALGAAVAAVMLGASIGYVVGSLFVLTRYASQISSALFAPVALLGGLMIDPETLPAALQWVPWAVGLINVRLAAIAPNAVVFWSSIAYIFSLTILYALAGRQLMAAVLRRTRKDATLDLY